MAGLSHAATGFGLGIALGVSPGPVQILLLTEAARGGLKRGFRAQAGANGTFLVLLLVLAAGVTAVSPSGPALRVLEVAGGALLLWIAVDAAIDVFHGHDIERAESRAHAAAAAGPGRRRATTVLARPETRGVLAVVLNPGGWLFLATTATALVADATEDEGRLAAFVTVLALIVGVSIMDGITVLLGGGGSLLSGRAGRWIRLALTLALAAIGVLFVIRGIAG
ncbi:MAG TPA: LysE family transporter [Actinomycetota bacterium]